MLSKLRILTTTQQNQSQSFIGQHLAKKFNGSNLPFYTKTLAYLDQSEDALVAAPKLHNTPPWLLKICKIDTSLSLVSPGKKHNSPKEPKSLALELIDKYSNSAHIYTDARKTIDGKTAAAFCLPKIDIRMSIRLTNNVTIFAAELTAIKLALLWITNTSDENISQLETWANAQRDGRPAEYRWRPLFNAAKFG